MRRRRSLWLRLLGAFVIVAALAVASFAGLVLWSTNGELHDLVRRQQQQTLRETAGALADAYREAGTWADADLRPAQAIAVASGALMQVREVGGAVVEQPGVPPGLWAATAEEHLGDSVLRRAAVVVAGERVGTVALRLPATWLPPPERSLRSALFRTAALGVVLAAIVAIAVGAAVAWRLLGPLRRLSAAVERVGRGDRTARAACTAPGELGALGDAVDRMAGNLEREEELRRELVADVSHELRTPVTILAAELERLVDGTVDPSPERLGSMYEEALRLGRRVEDVEALALSGAASMSIERRPVRLERVVSEVAESVRPQFETAHVLLEVRPRAATVDGDADRIAQVVRNLLTNALKFTRPGGSVTVSLARRGADAVITVVDTGSGIPADELPHVFERFWRGRASGRVSGSGIGLAVADELVRAHSGTLAAASDGEHGSTFTVALPLALEEASPVHASFTRSPHARR